MLFNSLEFALFFPLVCAIYFALGQKQRLPWLLIASCGFYMAFIPSYIVILFVTIAIDYVAGISIERTSGRARRAWLVGSVISTCVVLVIFKYYNFFVGSFTSVAQLCGWNPPDLRWNIILPIGLSFHTFQSLSYVVEVYRGRQKAEYDPVVYATYVMFFPQLVAGPIERPQNLLHQFREFHRYEHARVTSGLKRMAWGFFKKLVVADRLALYVNDVYGQPRNYNGLQLTLATVFFAYQIYCDFSGYSDIAIGTARVLGFNLMENFDTPYYSRSVSEFWRRWHISLSTWFKDYVYVPLGGSRVSTPRWTLNIIITFGLSGLWHGANWTYVLWGLLNAVYLISGQLTRNVRDKIFGSIGWSEARAERQVLMIGSTFVLTCAAWVLFRAGNFADAKYIFTHLFSGWDLHQIKTPHFHYKHFPAAIAALVILEVGQLTKGRQVIPVRLAEFPLPVRWTAYASFVFFVLLLGVYNAHEFIYFQF